MKNISILSFVNFIFDTYRKYTYASKTNTTKSTQRNYKTMDRKYIRSLEALFERYDFFYICDKNEKKK